VPLNELITFNGSLVIALSTEAQLPCPYLTLDKEISEQVWTFFTSLQYEVPKKLTVVSITPHKVAPSPCFYYYITILNVWRCVSCKWRYSYKISTYSKRFREGNTDKTTVNAHKVVPRLSQSPASDFGGPLSTSICRTLMAQI